MKILRERIREHTFVKWAGYLIILYVLASWGVNGVINPVHYLRNAQMKICGVEPLAREDGLAIDLSSGGDNGLKYLSFYIAQADEYSFTLRLSGSVGGGEVQEKEAVVWKGWNSLDLREYPWKEAVVPDDLVQQAGILFENVQLTGYQKVDTERMLSVFGAFCVMAVFCECMRWVKEHYAR